MNFTCPQCAGHTFGSAQLLDHSLRRFCNGTGPCMFSWHETDDAKYGLERPDEYPAVGEAPKRPMQVEITYFKEGGKYYTDGKYASDAKYYFDAVDELHELFAKGKRPGLSDNPGGGLGDFIALVQCKMADGTDDVPHLVTPASNKDYISKRPARTQLKLGLLTKV